MNSFSRKIYVKIDFTEKMKYCLHFQYQQQPQPKLQHPFPLLRKKIVNIVQNVTNSIYHM